MASGGLSSVLKQPNPPTPPRHLDKIFDEAIKSLETRYPSITPPKPSAKPSPPTAHTDTPPPSSPLQQSTSDAEPILEKRKRLRFSAETSIIGSSLDGSADASSTPPASSAPAKAQQTASSKSILKVSEYRPLEQSSPPTPQSDPIAFPSANSPESLPMMLQSVVTALAGPDLYSRRDAYSALSNCLRTYKNFPDFDNLVSRLPSLQQYLLRDMAGSHDLHKLPEQALNCAFLLLGRFPQAMSIDFRKSIIERIVTMLEEKAETKEVAKLQLNMLTLRELYGKAMTPERAKKVLKGVTEVDRWVGGSSVVGLRMIVYRQMIQHHPNVFIENAQSYLPPIFHGLMSSTKELRSRAMETGTVLGQILGQRQRVSKAVEALMETKSDQGQRYANFVQNQLLRMFDRAYDVEHVPQLWGTIMLMLRGTPSFLKDWLQSKEWCLIIQKCFNKSDEKVNRYAWNAWNYTIFATGSRLVENESICKRLIQPVIGHLQRPWNGEQVDTMRHAARSTLTLLLYTAFGQPSSDPNLIACWNQLIRDVCQKVVAKCPSERAFLVETISRLLSGPGLKVWRPERALDIGHLPMTREDVPYIDPRWQRRNVAVILEFFSVFRPTSTQETATHTEDPAFTLWQCLISSISVAGEKEIQMSLDLKRAVAAMLNYLHGLTIPPQGMTDSSNHANAYLLQDLAPFMCVAIERLGPDCFASKAVRRNKQGNFEVPPTPSKHLQGSSGHLEAPLASMVRISARCPTARQASRATRSPASSVLQPFLGMRGGTGCLLHLLSDSASSLSIEASSGNFDLTSSKYLWEAIAGLATTALQQSTQATRQQGATSLGQVYLDVVQILSVGLSSSDVRSWGCFTSLYNTTCRCIREDAGDAGYLLALTGPLVQKAVDLGSLKLRTLLSFLTLTLDEGFPAPDDKGLAQAAKALGEHFISKLSGGPFEWLSGLCALLSKTWTSSYAELAIVDHASLDAFFHGFSALYDSLPRLEPRLGAAWTLPITEVRQGLCTWLDDKDGMIARYTGRGYDIAKAVDDICSRHLKFICRKQFRDHCHKSFEAYLVAGLRSHRTSIANRAITAWNDIVDTDTEIEISGHLSGLLQQLANFADVRLPAKVKAFEESTDGASGMPDVDRDSFPGLQNGDSQTSQSLPGPKFLPSAYAHSRPHISRPLVASAHSTPTKAPARSNKARKTPPPRLRHDDSQIQFVAVTSSPMQPDEQESQFLTAHQKEIRERQQVGAAMFADLRSSSPMRPHWPAVTVSARDVETLQRPITAGFDGTDDDEGYSVFRRKPAAPPRPGQAKPSEQREPIQDPAILAEKPHKPGREQIESSDTERSLQTEPIVQNRAVPSFEANTTAEKVSNADATAQVPVDTEQANVQYEAQDVPQDADTGENGAHRTLPKDVIGAHEQSDIAEDVFHDVASSPNGTVQDASLVDSSLPDPKEPETGALQTPAQQTLANQPTTEKATDQARTSRVEDSFGKEQLIREPDKDVSSPLGGQVHEATSSEDVNTTGESRSDRNAPQVEQAKDDSSQVQEDRGPVEAANENEDIVVANPDANAEPASSDSPLQQIIIDDEEAGDCITVEEPDASTPPLTDLLKARGALKGQGNSQSPSVQVQKRGRGRPRGSSVKRSFSAVDREDVASNASSQQTPVQARSERAKRRKTDSQLSQSQMSASRELTPRTSAKPRQRRRTPLSSQEPQPSPSLKRKREETDDGGHEDTQAASQSQEENKVQEADQAAVTSSQPAAEDSQPRGLMARLRAMIEDVKKAWLNPEQEEEASELAYKLQREIGRAGRRFGN